MHSPTPTHRCYARVDLAALERNLGRIRSALPDDIRYISVVKADAYGHGLRPMATRLMQSGADAFAVANVNEAAELRELGHGWRILILGPALPEEYPLIFQYKVTPTISSIEEAIALDRLAEQKKQTLEIHLKIDTGMGRSGVWFEQAEALFETLIKCGNLRIHGIFTHFSSADSDAEYTRLQRIRFLDTLARFKNFDISTLWIHADNSAGLESFNEHSPFNAVRIGLLQFGLPPCEGSLLESLKTEPVLSFETRICLLKQLPKGTSISYGRTRELTRDSRIAIVSAGYGDGIPRSLSNCGEVIIRGRRCPILGKITMDQTIVDTTNLDEVAVGDTVVLLGKQGNEVITADEFAERSGSIPCGRICRTIWQYSLRGFLFDH